MTYTLKGMAENGYIMGLTTIGEVATHMELHHDVYFSHKHFDTELYDFQTLIDGHEDESIDLYLSAEEKKQMDDELDQALREGPAEKP